MTRVRLGRRFDAVPCLFDSINHLLRWARWEALFDRAGEHLEPNGVFVFHVNTPSRLAALAAGQPWVLSFDGNLLVLDVREARRGVFDWHIQVFEHTGAARYRLHEETIRSAATPPSRSARGCGAVSVKYGCAIRTGRARAHAPSGSGSSPAGPDRGRSHANRGGDRMSLAEGPAPFAQSGRCAAARPALPMGSGARPGRYPARRKAATVSADRPLTCEIASSDIPALRASRIPSAALSCASMKTAPASRSRCSISVSGIRR